MSDESRRSDELVSAYLDGEATPAEVAEVERDGALLARVEQLRAVRDAIAAPVPPMSAERRDQMIGAALEVADAEAAERREARIIPLHRPRQTLLAVAAAAVVLAAVVGAGLITSRGGDDSAETAADAPTASAGAAVEAAPADADMAMADEGADYEMAAEPMAEEEPMEEEAPMADEAMALEAMADEAMAEPESAMEAPAAEMVDDTAATASSGAGDVAEPEQETEEERRRDDSSALQTVDLGTLEDLDSLFENIGASWSAALDDGAMADSGACSAAVHTEALDSSAQTLQSFVATVGTEDPLTYDARFVRRPDGTALIIYAAPPGCEVESHELDEPDDS